MKYFDTEEEWTEEQIVKYYVNKPLHEISELKDEYILAIIDYLREDLNNAKKYCEKQKTKMYKSRNKIALFVLMKLEKILNRTIGE